MNNTMSHKKNNSRSHRYAVLVVFMIVFAGAFYTGCSNRGNPVVSYLTNRGISSWLDKHVYLETQFSQFNNLVTTNLRIYTPPGYQPKFLGRPYPVLYLLSPFRGSEYFYFSQGIESVLDDMINAGEIEPMIVVCVNGSGNAFGGGFYSDYITSGRYEQLVGGNISAASGLPKASPLTSRIDTLFNTIPGSDFRAISGYEMGGYGAFRCAVTSDTAYTAVSAISAPLYFTDPVWGFQPLFQQAINEWGGFNNIDTSATARVTSWLVAAAAGFSPEDTAYYPDPTNDLLNGVEFQVDSIGKIIDPSGYDTTIDTNGMVIDTTITYNPPTDLTFNAFPNTQTKEDGTLRIFLPFDATGAAYWPIWQVWVKNDMRFIIDTIPQVILDSLSGNILLMGTRDAKFGNFYQTQLFGSQLTTKGIGHFFEEYQGYDDFADTDGARYLFGAWRKLLKFHSDKFHDNIPVEIRMTDYTKMYP